MIVKWVHQLFFESPFFQSQWQNISLSDIREKKKLAINTVAANDFYEMFYEQLEKSGYDFYQQARVFKNAFLHELRLAR